MSVEASDDAVRGRLEKFEVFGRFGDRTGLRDGDLALVGGGGPGGVPHLAWTWMPIGLLFVGLTRRLMT